MSDKKRIVILSAFLSPFRSGAEACAEEVALRLADRYDITIVTARMRRDQPAREMLRDAIPIIRVGIGATCDKWLYPFLAPRIVRSLRPDLVHAILETFAGLAMKRCAKIRKLLTLQTTNRRFMKKSIVQSADRVTAISSVLQKQAQTYRRDPVDIIPNGIDLSAFPREEKISGRIIYVGRLEPMKGVDIVLRAFASIIGGLPTEKRKEYYLRIIGDGSQRTTLERLANELGIHDCVKFVGYVPVPHVYSEFAKAEIFCGLSRSEALGNVFLEAQAAGCAVVATHVGGIPDIVQDGRTGLLIPPNDVNAATSALRRLMQDESLRNHLAVQGRENARAYDWDVIADRYVEVYESMIVG